MIRHLAIYCFLIGCPWLAQASLEWESTQLNVPAEVGQDQVIGVFKFTNTGDTTVTIKDSQTSCGCTIPELAKHSYAPGESGELKAIFTVGDRIGPQRKTITVTTDDPEASSVHLVLETNIPTIATFTPKILLWRKHSEPEWKEVKISTAADVSVTVGEADNGETLPPHELVAVEGTPGDYVLRLHPMSTNERLQVKFPITVQQASGLSRNYTIFVLVR